MDIVALKTELTAGHPDTGPYDADPTIAAEELNAVNRTRNRTSMTGSEVINNVNATEWADLSTADQQIVWDVVHLGEVNPFGVEATLLTNVFGGGSTTITALASARKEDVSRAVEQGLGFVKAGYVIEARRI